MMAVSKDVSEPQFQRDFISLLPKELALHFLRFLTPRYLNNEKKERSVEECADNPFTPFR
jgi:hypothetical protein